MKQKNEYWNTASLSDTTEASSGNNRKVRAVRSFCGSFAPSSSSSLSACRCCCCCYSLYFISESLFVPYHCSLRFCLPPIIIERYRSTIWLRVFFPLMNCDPEDCPPDGGLVLVCKSLGLCSRYQVAFTEHR